MRRIAALVLGTAIATTLAPAAAQADEIPAPSTRAAAEVSPTGTLVKEKNIDQAWRADTGQYCVTLTADVPVDEVVVQINPRQYRLSTYTTTPSPWCDRTENTVTVGIRNVEGQYVNAGFTLVAQWSAAAHAAGAPAAIGCRTATPHATAPAGAKPAGAVDS